MSLALTLGIALIAQAAPAPPADPAPPRVLAEHLVDGLPDPAQLDWMRGLFKDATPEQRAEWQTIEDWLLACRASGLARVRAELAAMGRSDAQLERFAAGDLACRTVAALRPPDAALSDWDAYSAANEDAGRVFAIFHYGAKNGFEAAPFDPDWVNEEAQKLLRATVLEQVYRGAMSWQASGPDLPPLVATALERRFWLAASIEDAKNTEMLKALVAKKGWPTISRMGKRASYAAWLLVQHADHDPAFQLQILRLMEPLVVKDEVNRGNYAYLYDRVRLKISGRQRYGTQVHCEAGKRVPLPLEAGIDLDAERAEMTLDPIADYIAGMDEAFPPCPA